MERVLCVCVWGGGGGGSGCIRLITCPTVCGHFTGQSAAQSFSLHQAVTKHPTVLECRQVRQGHTAVLSVFGKGTRATVEECIITGWWAGRVEW